MERSELRELAEQGRGNGISETNGMNFGRGRGAEPITHQFHQ